MSKTNDKFSPAWQSAPLFFNLSERRGILPGRIQGEEGGGGGGRGGDEGERGGGEERKSLPILHRNTVQRFGTVKNLNLNN